MRHYRRPALSLESLEARLALATALVNTLGTATDFAPLDGACDVDSVTPGDQCTLTAAAQHLNANSGGTLTLAISDTFGGVNFTQPVTIDGAGHTLTSDNAAPLALSAGGNVRNLTLHGSLDLIGSGGVIENNTIRDGQGLFVAGDNNTIRQNVLVATDGTNFLRQGAVTVLGSQNRVEQNSLGVDDGVAVANGGHGIFIDGSFQPANENVIINNTISASITGIDLRGPFASGNRIEGNRIGTDATGMVDMGNWFGVNVSQAVDTIIGTPGAGANLISGNLIGIWLEDSPGTVVQNNWIGLSASGTPLGNSDDGIYVFSNGERDDVTIRENTISSNGLSGVHIESSGVKLFSNRIGTDPTGLLPRGNTGDGIRIQMADGMPDNGDNGSFNTVGAPGQANLIAANQGDGVAIVGGTSNIVQGNIIGLGADTNTILGNGRYGVSIIDGLQNAVGGINVGNLISGNGQTGVHVQTSHQTSILGNTIGLSGNNALAAANQLHGVELRGGGDNRIGGAENGAGNMISGNVSHGILIGNQASNTVVVRNTIGTNPQGAPGLGNGGDGIHVDAAPETTIGLASLGNAIVASGGTGIAVNDSDQVQIRGNLVGISFNNAASPNQQGGIHITASSQTVIGGTLSGDRNVVSGNGQFGIALGNTSNSQVLGNSIGTDLSGNAGLPGGQQPIGVLLESGSTGNSIGLENIPNSGNLISGNSGPGVQIRHQGTSNNQVSGNIIGLGGSLQTVVVNQGDGILITDNAGANIIGGTLPGATNVIAGNLGNGVRLDGGATLNEIKWNAIGFNPNNGQPFGNGGHGVRIDTATNNLIGDPTGAAGNSIRWHGQFSAVRVNDGAIGNRILGNSMFQNAAGGIMLTGALANRPRQPIIRSVTPGPTGFTVAAQVIGQVGTTVRVDFFASQQAPSSGFGEGQVPLGSTNVLIPAGGVASVSVTLAPPDGSYFLFTATLTDAANTTYDFSRATTPNHRPVTVQSLLTTGPTNDSQPVQFTATLQSGFGNPDGVVEFFDGDTRLGQASINGQSQAILSASIPQSGVHTIRAVYKGSIGFGGAISDPLAVTITGAPPNQAPIASNDNEVVAEDGNVAINVLANDSDPDGGTIIASSVTITQAPLHGTAVVNVTTGIVTYTPDENYDGSDQFRYKITDNRGGVSSPALVSITVTDTPEPYYNQATPLDVDGDTHISPTDVVLIINLLNARGTGTFPPPAGEIEFFYDANGDNALGPIDALLVINHLNAHGVSEGEAETPAVVAEASPLVPALHDAALAAWLAWDEAETSQRKAARPR